MRVRPLTPDDRVRVVAGWGSRVARRGELVDVTDLPGFVAELDGEVAGAVTFAVRGRECEIVTLEAWRPRAGAGTALVAAVAEAARAAGSSVLWLVTTNDNRVAVAFYEAVGFELTEVRRGAVDEARRSLKPEIPLRGHDGVAVSDELEYRRAP